MRRAPGIRVGAVVPVAVALGVATAPARASCAEITPWDELPVVFEGRALERLPLATPGMPPPGGFDYRWRVERPIRGVDEGSEIVVTMAVRLPVEDSGHGAVVGVSSVDIGPAPELGALYRVGATAPVQDDGAVRHFASKCGGSLDRLAGPVNRRDVVDHGLPTFEEVGFVPAAAPDAPRPISPVLVVIALAALAASAAGLLRRRARRVRTHHP